MYRQFCKNLNNFININRGCDGQSNSRLAIAMQVLPISDISSYLEYKKNSDPRYFETSMLIHSLSQFNNVFPSIKKFIWELWAYGFDIEPLGDLNIAEPKDTHEMARIVDLLLSTHYF